MMSIKEIYLIFWHILILFFPTNAGELRQGIERQRAVAMFFYGLNLDYYISNKTDI